MKSRNTVTYVHQSRKIIWEVLEEDNSQWKKKDPRSKTWMCLHNGGRMGRNGNFFLMSLGSEFSA